MKSSLLIILIFIFLSSCDKEVPLYVPEKLCPDLSRNLDSISKYISGYWEWIEEKRFDQINGGYDYLTPKTEGYTLQIKISNDTVRLFKNNIPDSVYRYQIQLEREITNYPTDSLPVMVYYSFLTGRRKSYVPIKICSDYLVREHQHVSSVVGRYIWKRK